MAKRLGIYERSCFTKGKLMQCTAKAKSTQGKCQMSRKDFGYFVLKFSFVFNTKMLEEIQKCLEIVLILPIPLSRNDSLILTPCLNLETLSHEHSNLLHQAKFVMKKTALKSKSQMAHPLLCAYT